MKAYRLVESGSLWEIFEHAGEFIARCVYTNCDGETVKIEHTHFSSLRAALEFCV